MEAKKKKICPFLQCSCPSKDFSCALFDDKRQCCGLIPMPQKMLIPESGKITTDVEIVLLKEED